MTQNFITKEEFEVFQKEIRSQLVELMSLMEILKPTIQLYDDEPPIAPKAGKAFIGSKFDFRVRVDQRLADEVIKLAKRDYGNNISRAMDVILWRYFNRPKLSWED